MTKSWENDESRRADEKFGKWWNPRTWWKVWKVMKVDNLMKSLESDESWQPDEKFGKWWNSTTWWKVGKVMKSGKTLKKMQFASRSFFSTFFCTSEFCPKVVLWFWGDLFWQAKATEELFGKTRMKMIWTSNQIKRKLWTKQSYKPPISTSNIAQDHFAFYFWMLLSRPQVWIKPQMQTLQEVGELLWSVPIFTSIDVQKRSRKISLYK